MVAIHAPYLPFSLMAKTNEPLSRHVNSYMEMGVHKHTHKFCYDAVFYVLTTINMAAVWNSEILPDKFNVVKTCTIGNKSETGQSKGKVVIS
jgi:hypothetical protein